MSIFPVLWEFYPLAKLWFKKGATLPWYFQFYLKNKKKYIKYKKEDTEESLQVLLGDKLAKRKNKIKKIDNKINSIKTIIYWIKNKINKILENTLKDKKKE